MACFHGHGIGTAPDAGAEDEVFHYFCLQTGTNRLQTAVLAGDGLGCAVLVLGNGIGGIRNSPGSIFPEVGLKGSVGVPLGLLKAQGAVFGSRGFVIDTVIGADSGGRGSEANGDFSQVVGVISSGAAVVSHDFAHIQEYSGSLDLIHTPGGANDFIHKGRPPVIHF